MITVMVPPSLARRATSGVMPEETVKVSVSGDDGVGVGVEPPPPPLLPPPQAIKARARVRAAMMCLYVMRLFIYSWMFMGLPACFLGGGRFGVCCIAVA